MSVGYDCLEFIHASHHLCDTFNDAAVLTISHFTRQQTHLPVPLTIVHVFCTLNFIHSRSHFSRVHKSLPSSEFQHDFLSYLSDILSFYVSLQRGGLFKVQFPTNKVSLMVEIKQQQQRHHSHNSNLAINIAHEWSDPNIALCRSCVYAKCIEINHYFTLHNSNQGRQ